MNITLKPEVFKKNDSPKYFLRYFFGLVFTAAELKQQFTFFSFFGFYAAHVFVRYPVTLCLCHYAITSFSIPSLPRILMFLP